jgi:hypothetical protein
MNIDHACLNPFGFYLKVNLIHRGHCLFVSLFP